MLPATSAMPRDHHQLHMANDLSPAGILAEILSSGPTVVIMAPACVNESPAAVPQSSGAHIGPTACFLVRKVQLHQPAAYVLNQYLQLLIPHRRGSTDTTTATPASSGAAPTTATEPSWVHLRLLLLLLLPGSSKYRRAAQVVARKSSEIVVVVSAHLKHSSSDVTASASAGDIVVVPLNFKHQPSDVTVAAEIFVVNSLHLEHLPSRSYESQPSTAKC